MTSNPVRGCLVFSLLLFATSWSNVVVYYPFDDAQGYTGYCDFSPAVPSVSLVGSASVTSALDSNSPISGYSAGALLIPSGTDNYGLLSQLDHLDPERDPVFSSTIRSSITPNRFSFSVWFRVNAYNNGEQQMLLYKEDAFELYISNSFGSSKKRDLGQSASPLDERGGECSCCGQRSRLVWRLYDNEEDDQFTRIFIRCSSGSPPDVNVPVNTWHHVAGTFDGSRMRLYVDGNLEENRSFSSTLAREPDGNIYLGNIPSVTDEYLDGYLDELYLFDDVLSSAEITALASNAPQPSATFPTFTFDTIPNITGVHTDGKTLYSIPAASNFNMSITSTQGVEHVFETGLSEDCEELIELTPGSGLAPTTADIASIPPFSLGETRVDFCAGSDTLSSSDYFWVETLPILPIITINFENTTQIVQNQTTILGVTIVGSPPPQLQWQFGDPEANVTTPARVDRWIDEDDEDAYRIGRHAARGNVSNATLVWQNVPGATGFQLSLQGDESIDGWSYRVVASNVAGTSISDATQLELVQNIDGGGDGGGGDGGGGTRGGGSSSSSAAIGGAVAAVLLACCLIVLLVICCCALIVCALLVFAALLGVRQSKTKKHLKMPDTRVISYGVYLDPQHDLTSGDKEALAQLERLLVEHNDTLPSAILSVCDTADMDRVCASLLYVMDSNGLAYDLLQQRIRVEGEQASDEGTLFRLNSSATKFFTRYSRLVSHQYLWDCFAVLIYKMHSSMVEQDDKAQDSDDELSGAMSFDMMSAMSIGPSGGASDFSSLGDDLINIMQLQLTAQRILKIVLAKRDSIPNDVVCALKDVHEVVEGRDFSEIATYRAIGGFFFLRFICPALVSPQSSGILTTTVDSLHQNAHRNLVLIGKVMQNLANNTLPGNKEEHMAPLNKFVTDNVGRLEIFYDEVIRRGYRLNPSGRVGNEPQVQENSLYTLFVHLQRTGIAKLSSVYDGDELDELESILQYTISS